LSAGYHPQTRAIFLRGRPESGKSCVRRADDSGTLIAGQDLARRRSAGFSVIDRWSDIDGATAASIVDAGKPIDAAASAYLPLAGTAGIK
jgi:hypothetical protein